MVVLDISQRLTYLGPKEHWQSTEATNDHHCEKTAPSCPVRPSDCRIITLEYELLTKQKYAPAAEREHKAVRIQEWRRYLLGRKVVNLARCGMVLFREFEKGRDAYIGQIDSIPVKMASLLLYTNQFRNRSRG